MNSGTRSIGLISQTSMITRATRTPVGDAGSAMRDRASRRTSGTTRRTSPALTSRGRISQRVRRSSSHAPTSPRMTAPSSSTTEYAVADES